MIKAVIVDDEKNPRETIKSILISNFNEISVVAEADSLFSGIEIIKKNKPDLVFLDIDLKDGTGFDLLEKLLPVDFKIIFVTGFHDYAIKAFKFSALDYILKPINSLELETAIKKAISEIKLANQAIKLEALFANFHNITQETKKIVLKTQESIHLINIQNIIRCESDNSYITFYLNDGKKIIISNSLKDYEEILEPYGFYRVHQSHLINLNCILRYDKKDGGYIVMIDNSIVAVSQRKKNELMQKFENM